MQAGNTDIVYVLGKGSLHANLELKCSIKSVLMNAEGVRNIYVIGEHPGYTGPFVHIYFPDCGRGKQDNIRKKIEVACAHPDISDDFLFMNDDHFFNAPVNITELPNYCNHDIQVIYHRRKRKEKDGPYMQAMKNTFDELQDRGMTTDHFDLHVPILFNKTLFPEVMALYNWKQREYIIKSLYANTLKLERQYLEECNVAMVYESVEAIEQMVGDRPLFSVSNGGMDDLFSAFIRSKYSETFENQ